MDNQKIGKFIAILRKENNLTQKDLAEKLGITDRAISKWERGLCCPDISLLDDLSKILKVSVLEILKGRKLEKDEKVENKDLIETMSFYEKSGKDKVKNIINKISIIIVLLISSYLVYGNIKSIYLMNKKYKTSWDIIDSNILFDNTLNNIELILNNQGIYTNDDYDKIIKYVNDIKYFIDIENDKKMFEKEEYNYKDIIKESTSTIYEVFGFNLPDNNIYEIIIKYDINKLKKANYHYSWRNEFLNVTNDIYVFLNSTYYYNKNINIDVAAKIKEKIFYKYFLYKMTLEDIIEVGDINE